MTVWIAAAFALLVCFAACFALTLRRSEGEALAAAQAAGTLLLLLFVVLGVWWDQTSLFFVALAGAVLALPSGLVMARLLTREIEK